MEDLTSIPSELIAGDASVAVSQEHFDAENVTHAMITADGQTVPITLNPETGQFMTPDGQTVQVQMAADETAYQDESESVLPDAQEESQFDPTAAGTFQVITSEDVAVEKPEPQPQTVVIKQENLPLEASNIPGNLQLIQGENGAVVSYECRLLKIISSLKLLDFSITVCCKFQYDIRCYT